MLNIINMKRLQITSLARGASYIGQAVDKGLKVQKTKQVLDQM
jgi:hypothetical protein